MSYWSGWSGFLRLGLYYTDSGACPLNGVGPDWLLIGVQCAPWRLEGLLLLLILQVLGKLCACLVSVKVGSGLLVGLWRLV